MTFARGFAAGAVVAAVFSVGLVALAHKKQDEESERKIKEAEVPAAALAALKKVANGAKLSEFTEEKEHGHTFYEGSYAGPDGNVDVLVTPTGIVARTSPT